jgi:hypothetical protein
MGEQKRIMTYAIIQGKNGRRHEVDFGDSPVRVEVYASEETIEIFVEADFESLPDGRRRFALINTRGKKRSLRCSKLGLEVRRRCSPAPTR